MMKTRTRMESMSMKSKSLRLLIGDPGRTNDPFGVIGLEATWPKKKIFIRYAKQFKKKPYSFVAKEFWNLNNKLKFDMMLLEKNFDYENVSKAFATLPITYVSTSSSLTEKTRAKGWAVDKPFMIGWLKEQYPLHTIQFPKSPRDDMEELLNQRRQIVGITAPSGHTAYKAQRGRHDDLFMAQLIGCNAVRIWWSLQ